MVLLKSCPARQVVMNQKTSHVSFSIVLLRDYHANFNKKEKALFYKL